MKIVLRPSFALAAIWISLYTLPALSLLAAPIPLLLFLLCLILSLGVGYETARRHALMTSKTAIKSLIIPEAEGEAWGIQYQSGFVQQADKARFWRIGNLLWVQIGREYCLVTPSRVSSQAWSALCFLQKFVVSG